MRRPKISAAFVVAAAFAAFGPASAQALTTIGQLAPANPPTTCVGGPNDAVQAQLSSGTSYSVPAPGGVITSWSTNAAAGTGQTLKLKVFLPVSANSYTVVAHDGPRTLIPSALNTFAVEIPVQAGDVIGLNDQNAPAAHSACLFKTGETGDEFAASAIGDAADGSTETIAPAAGGFKLNITATVQQPPAITAVGPPQGSISGGTSVVISGHDFAAVSAVKFGSTPASSFTVNSENAITAVAPSNATSGPVDTSVTTVAGTSAISAADQFTYTAELPTASCVVPKLKGKKVKAARKALTKADCKLGKVKGKKTKSAKVKKQSPKVGNVLPPGAKVNIKLGG
jgi:hypothetical protein